MKKILMKIIRFYQKHISPATQPTCRYHPTCSNYALKAIDQHGAVKGGIMGTARVLRCNPFVEGGVDKVPDYFTLRRNPENIGEQYIPDYLLSVDAEMKAEITELIEKYRDQLLVSDELTDGLEVLGAIADLEVLTVEDLRKEFSAEEIDYLKDIHVLPSLEKDAFHYFTITESRRNEEFFKEVHSYDDGIMLGENHPLIVIEETGLWYTNLPKLMNQFLIKRGVTKEDLENNSYHLWMVLKAIEAENQK